MTTVDLTTVSDGYLLDELDEISAAVAADVPQVGEMVHVAFQRLLTRMQRAALIQVELSRRAAASEGLPAAKHVVKVKPGDRVLVTFDRPMSMMQMEKARELLAVRFPDVEFTIAPQANDVAVIEADGHE